MGTLKDAIRDLDSVSDEVSKRYLSRLTRKLDDALEGQCRLFKLEKGSTLLRSTDDVSHIFILLKGEAEVISVQASGAIYAYARFKAPSMFGEYEVFAELDSFGGTIVCVSDCILVAMPARHYLMWMKSDAEVLLDRTKQIAKDLVNQVMLERSFLFCTGEERLLVYLCHMWKKEQRDGILTLKQTRQEIADKTGFCVKTMQRALSSLKTDELVSIKGRNIVINEVQYKMLRKRCRS